MLSLGSATHCWPAQALRAGGVGFATLPDSAFAASSDYDEKHGARNCRINSSTVGAV
jgi:hypothetical protein